MNKLIYTVVAVASILVLYGLFRGENDSAIEVMETMDAQGRKITEKYESSPLALDTSTTSTLSVDGSVLATSYKGFGAVGRDQKSFEKDEDIYTNEEIERENIVEVCMEDYGFVYYSSPSIAVDENTSETDIEEMLMRANPNAEYFENLSPDEKVAYNMALFGVINIDVVVESVEYEEVMAGDSCVAQAFRKIPGVYSTKNILQEQIHSMEESIRQDERVVMVDDKWSFCMDKKGYRFKKMSDVYRQLDVFYSYLYEGESNGEDEPEMTGQLVDILNTASLHEDPNIVQRKVEEYLDNVEVESELCASEVGYYQTMEAVKRSHENQFIQENKDVLKGAKRE